MYMSPSEEIIEFFEDAENNGREVYIYEDVLDVLFSDLYVIVDSFYVRNDLIIIEFTDGSEERGFYEFDKLDIEWFEPTFDGADLVATMDGQKLELALRFE